MAALRITPHLITRLAGYARWLDHLVANNQEWHSQDLRSTPLAQLLQCFNGQTPSEIELFQVRFCGKDWQGEFDRESHLCLSEGEASMVVREVHGPKPKASRLHFNTWLNASFRPVSLAEVLDSSVFCQRLAGRLNDLIGYRASDYQVADAACFWMDGRRIGHLLFRQGALLQPEQPQQHLPFELRCDFPFKVWSSDGLAGIMNGPGIFLLPCRYTYLSGPCDDLLEVSTDPVPAICGRSDYWDFLNYHCTILNTKTGKPVNPPQYPALRGSLGFGPNFCALGDQRSPQGRPLIGFMDGHGQWLGRPAWSDILLFNEGRAAVQDPVSKLWGFIDAQGTEIIPPAYLDSNFFNCGLAIVEPASNPGKRIVINAEGKALTAPWKSIEHGHNETFQIKDDTGYWGLLNKEGQLVVEPQPIDPHLDEDERRTCLYRQLQAHRAAQAKLLDTLPLPEAIAQLRPQSRRDLSDYGLWHRKVIVNAVSEHWQTILQTPMTGFISWSSPVGEDMFDLSQEAPVVLEKPDGDTVTLGIPWGDLVLA